MNATCGLGILCSDHVETYHLDTSKVRELEYMVETTPAIQECVDLIRFTLFQNIQLEGHPIKEFHDLFRNYHVPFYEDALRCCIAVGFVVVSTRRVKYEYGVAGGDDQRQDILDGQDQDTNADKGTGKDTDTDTKKRKRTQDSYYKKQVTWAEVPVVVPFSSVNVKLHYDTMTNDIAFEIKRMRGPISPTPNAPPLKVICFTSIDSFVREGVANSVCTGLLDQFRYIKQLERFYIQAEYTRSNPSFVLQPSPTGIGGGSGSGGAEYQQATFAYDFVNSSTGGHAGFNDTQRTSALQFGTAHMSLFSNYRHHQDEISQVAQIRERNCFDVDSSFAPQWHNNSFVVPPGMQMGATPHMPTATIDTMGNTHLFAENVRSKFGFPDSIFRATGATGHASRNKQQNNSQHQNGPGRGTANLQSHQLLTPIDVNRFDTAMKVFRDFFTKLYRHSFIMCMKTEPPGNIIFDEPPVLKAFINEVKEEASNRRTSRLLDLEQKKLNVAQAKRALAEPPVQSKV